MVSRLGAKKKSGGGGGFSYKKRTADDVKKRAEQSGGRFDSPFKQGFDVFRPKDGENLIRILPPTWDDHDHYGLDVWMHRFIGADNSNYLCANKMLGKHCPACDEAKAAKDAGEDDEAKSLQPQKRTLVWIIDRDDESNTPQIWDMSWAQDRDIAALCHIKRTGKVLLIDHPEDGYDLTVKKVGKGLKTRYTFIVDRESSPIHDEQKEQDKILEFITENPLTDVLRYDTAAHIEKQLSGTAPSKDEDLDDDDDKPRKKKRSRDRDEEEEDEKPKRRRGRDADEDEEEEEDRKPAKRRRSEPEEEEEEEDEKPAKKKRRVVEEEEEEEEEERKPAKRRRPDPEEEEEEEEEKPRKRRRAEPEEEEEEEEKPRKRRRAEPEEEEEEEEEEAPKKKKRRAEPEEEEEEEEEDERPRRRRR